MALVEMKLTKAQREYQQVIESAAASLGPDEFWMISHPDGPLEQTASRDVTHPIRVICAAMDLDWDELRESGFFITRAALSKSIPEEAKDGSR